MSSANICISKKVKWILLLLVIVALGLFVFWETHNNGICLTFPDEELKDTYWSYTEILETGEQEYIFYFDETGTILTLLQPTFQTKYIKKWHTWRVYCGNLLGKPTYKKDYTVTFSLNGDSLRIVETNNGTQATVVSDFTLKKRILTSAERIKYHSDLVIGVPEYEPGTDFATF